MYMGERQDKIALFIIRIGIFQYLKLNISQTHTHKIPSEEKAWLKYFHYPTLLFHKRDISMGWMGLTLELLPEHLVALKKFCSYISLIIYLSSFSSGLHFDAGFEVRILPLLPLAAELVRLQTLLKPRSSFYFNFSSAYCSFYI